MTASRPGATLSLGATVGRRLFGPTSRRSTLHAFPPELLYPTLHAEASPDAPDFEEAAYFICGGRFARHFSA